jgi:hypothetical protein
MKDLFAVILAIVLILGVLSVPPFVIMLAWNIVAVPLFTVKVITFWQAALAYLCLGVVGACFKSATK